MTAKWASHVAKMQRCADRPVRRGATASPPTEAILLTEMREMRGDDRLPADCAQAALVGEPVDLAQPRAGTAPVRPQQPERPLGADGDLPGAQAQVGRPRQTVHHSPPPLPSTACPYDSNRLTAGCLTAGRAALPSPHGQGPGAQAHQLQRVPRDAACGRQLRQSARGRPVQHRHRRTARSHREGRYTAHLVQLRRAPARTLP